MYGSSFLRVRTDSVACHVCMYVDVKCEKRRLNLASHHGYIITNPTESCCRLSELTGCVQTVPQNFDLTISPPPALLL